MNPFLLWAPGTALIVVGVLLMVKQVVTMPVAVVVMVVGAVLESAGCCCGYARGANLSAALTPGFGSTA